MARKKCLYCNDFKTIDSHVISLSHISKSLDSYNNYFPSNMQHLKGSPKKMKSVTAPLFCEDCDKRLFAIIENKESFSLFQNDVKNKLFIYGYRIMAYYTHVFYNDKLLDRFIELNPLVTECDKEQIRNVTLGLFDKMNNTIKAIDDIGLFPIDLDYRMAHEELKNQVEKDFSVEYCLYDMPYFFFLDFVRVNGIIENVKLISVVGSELKKKYFSIISLKDVECKFPSEIEILKYHLKSDFKQTSLSTKEQLKMKTIVNKKEVNDILKLNEESILSRFPYCPENGIYVPICLTSFLVDVNDDELPFEFIQVVNKRNKTELYSPNFNILLSLLNTSLPSSFTVRDNNNVSFDNLSWAIFRSIKKTKSNSFSSIVEVKENTSNYSWNNIAKSNFFVSVFFEIFSNYNTVLIKIEEKDNRVTLEYC